MLLFYHNNVHPYLPKLTSLIAVTVHRSLLVTFGSKKFSAPQIMPGDFQII